MKPFMKRPIKVDLTHRTVKAKFIAIVLLGVFLSCNSQKKVRASQASASNDVLRLLLHDNYSGIDTEKTLIIRSPEELQVFYSKINRTRKPGLPLPKIDFEKEMAVVYCAGLQEDGKLPLLYVVEETPNEMTLGLDYLGSNSGTAIVSPFCVYKLPATKKEIVVIK